MIKTVFFLFALALAGAMIGFYVNHKTKIHYFVNEHWYSRAAISEPVSFNNDGVYISIPIEHNGDAVNALFDTGSQTVKPVKEISEAIKSNSTRMSGTGFDGNAIDAYFHRGNELNIHGGLFNAYVGYVNVNQIENGDKLLERFNFLLGPELLPSEGLLYIDNVNKQLIPSLTKIDFGLTNRRLKLKFKTQFPTPKILIILDESLDWFLLDTGSNTEITSVANEQVISTLYESLNLPAMDSFQQGIRNVIGMPFINKFDLVEINYDTNEIYFLNN